MSVDYLAFEGGGTLIPAHAGVVQTYADWGYLHKLKGFAGSSAGSIVATLLAVKASNEQIKDQIMSFDFGELKDDSWGVFRDLWRLWKHLGFHKGDALLEKIETTLLEITGNKDMTFAEQWARYSKELVITGCWVYDNPPGMQLVYFNRHQFPNMRLADAVRISCGIPVFWAAYNWDGKVWVDGGTLCNFPVDAFDGTMQPGEKTLGYKLITNAERTFAHQPNIPNLKTFLKAVAGGTWEGAQRAHVKKSDWVRTVPVFVGNASSLDFDMSKAHKLGLFRRGQDAARDKLQDDERIRRELMNKVRKELEIDWPG
jgi:NTE family protein